MLRLGLLALAVLLTGGCRQEASLSSFMSFFHQEVTVPPVIVSTPVCLLSSSEGNFRHAGISFECHNTDSRAICSMEVSFIVYTDESGGNPFYGSNVISALVTADILPDASVTCEISLDSKLARIPDEPFCIDYFYVTKVVFADDSAWADPYGFYYAGSLLP